MRAGQPFTAPNSLRISTRNARHEFFLRAVIGASERRRRAVVSGEIDIANDTDFSLVCSADTCAREKRCAR